MLPTARAREGYTTSMEALKVMGEKVIRTTTDGTMSMKHNLVKKTTHLC